MQFQPEAFLHELLFAHSLSVVAQDGWLLPGGRRPAISGAWHEPAQGETGCLDVKVLLPDGRILVESFAGLGSGEDACKDALQSFVLGSFHVLLAAFWGRHDEQQVLVESWELPTGQWRAYLGNFTRRAFGSADVPVPDALFPALRQTLQAASLSGTCHWLRTYFCNVRSQQRVYEALLDNEVWAPARRALRQISWPPSDLYYSVRHFLVLVKAA